MSALVILCFCLLWFGCISYFAWMFHCLLNRRWRTLTILGCILTFFVFGLPPLVRSLTAPLNPWKAFGVRSTWQHYGNTGLEEALYEVDYQGRTISKTACPGATYDFVLRSEDTDADGIPEIIMENSIHRLVLAFYPARDGHAPEFKVLSDTPGP